MKILGTPNAVTAPSGALIGAAGMIPISAVQTTLAVGSIPTCRVTIPIEMLSLLPKTQDDNLYEVTVTDGSKLKATLFRGYIAGPRGRISDKEVSAGITLVHPARNMDQMRITAPSFHPASVFDYNYLIRFGKDNQGGSAFNFQDGRFFTGGNLPKSLVDGIILTLQKNTRSVRSEGVGTSAKLEALGPAIALLGTVKHLNGTIRDELVQPLINDGRTGNSINAWAESRVMGSFSAMRSVWDTLVTLFAEFGIYLLCDCQGQVFTLADCTGFKPPSQNVLGPEYIASAEWVSLFTRNIKEVNLICDHIAGRDVKGGGAAGTLVTYPQNSKEVGASLALQMPGWLSPLSSNDSAGLIKAQEALAKTFFLIERNKMRTMSVSGPLAPNVSPGTTATIQPFSKMRALSGGAIEDLTETFTGYCYQVDHVMDAQTKVLQTNFSFRNVSRGEEELITEHPIFSDVQPFPWA